MAVQLGPKSVVTSDGVEWRVCRRWLTRRPRLSRRRFRGIGSESLQNVGVPDLGGLDLGEGMVVLAGIVVVVLILVPLLFFGVELLVLGVLLAAGVLARTFLGRPWVIEADSVDPVAAGRHLEWQVRGWRRSARLIDEIATELAAGREPPRPDPPLPSG